MSQPCVLNVRVKPGARRQGLIGWADGQLEVAVHAPPEKGKANKALIELLAKELGLRKSQITLLSGRTGRRKRLQLTDVSPDDLQRRIAKVVPV